MAQPVANFTYSPVSGTYEIKFQDLSTNGAITYLWDFGDGNNSTDACPTHDFTRDGFFEVTLTATNGDGSNSITFPVGVRSAGPVLSQSVYTLINQYIPPNVTYDISELAGLIQKNQLYLQPLVSHIIADENVFNEFYWEPLENQLIASMAAYDILIQQANSSVVAANNGGSTSNRQIKKIVTGPTETEWYASSESGASSSSSLSSGGALGAILQHLCSLSKRLNIYLPEICEQIKVVVSPVVGNICPPPDYSSCGCDTDVSSQA